MMIHFTNTYSRALKFTRHAHHPIDNHRLTRVIWTQHHRVRERLMSSQSNRRIGVRENRILNNILNRRYVWEIDNGDELEE